MAITGIDSLITAALPQQIYFKGLTTHTTSVSKSMWPLAGIPGAGTYDTTLNGAILTSPVQGQIPLPDAAGANSNYLYNFSAITPGNDVTLMIADRIWSNQFDVTSSANQAITTPSFVRDVYNGANGVGLSVAVEISQATGAANPGIEIHYTTPDGQLRVGGANLGTSPPQGNWYPMHYDYNTDPTTDGVKAIRAVDLTTSWISGNAHLVVYRPIAFIYTVGNRSTSQTYDFLQLGLPKLFPGTVPFIVDMTSSSSSSWWFAGTVGFAQG